MKLKLAVKVQLHFYINYTLNSPRVADGGDDLKT